MHKVNFEDELEKILARDNRYDRAAYFFVREALDHTQKTIGKRDKSAINHVTGQQLLAGIKAYALNQYGPMVLTVFEEWGVHRCEDFGELVYNMIEQGLLSRTESDNRADFRGGYDFHDAFRKPFLPPSKLQSPATEPKAN